jgi:hypothetical protein
MASDHKPAGDRAGYKPRDEHRHGDGSHLRLVRTNSRIWTTGCGSVMNEAGQPI